ncbi:MAG: proline dehydrogenase family protein [Thermocrispum sp.]
MLRAPLIAASRSPRLRGLAERTALTRSVVDRFVAGEDADTAVSTVRQITGDRLVTLDLLGEDTRDANQADRTVGAYRQLLWRVADAGLATRVEASVKLSALGQALELDGEKIALENARQICAAAATVGTTVTVDMEDHTTTDSTLCIVRDLRVDFPWAGAVVQAYLRRTEADCAEFAGAGSRVRLCKGAYDEPASVAYRDKADVDASYVRCLRTLMDGAGYPMVATHDPRLIDIAEHLATRAGRAAADYEFQMLYGVRPHEQQRLASRGLRMRAYVPYGSEWYPYFMRRLAERPANLAFFLRSFASAS